MGSPPTWRHILAESGGLGAVLDEAAIPDPSRCPRDEPSDGMPALDHALNDGEDFELCLVVSADDAARLLAAPPRRPRSYRVGEITECAGSAAPHRRWRRSDRSSRAASTTFARQLMHADADRHDTVPECISNARDRVTDGLSIELASEDETTRLGRAIAELVEPGSSSAWSARSAPARPGWCGRSPKRWGSIPRRSRAPRSS